MERELPAHLANPPELNLLSIYYLDAYNLLGTCRQLGFGSAGPIPYTAISQYARDMGIKDREFESLVYIVTTVDADTLGDP